MNRFHGALRDVRHALRDARRGALCRRESQMERDLSEEDGVLRDSLVLLEIERTILDERMSVERALAKILEERRRLARLVRDEPSMDSDIRALARAFERVGRALGGRITARPSRNRDAPRVSPGSAWSGLIHNI
jgi:hypothetical protein